MSWTNLIYLTLHLIAFMEQLKALNIEPGEQNSAAKSLASLKSELEAEKAT
jgi:hypothetical protein